jgi:hypothetical protein
MSLWRNISMMMLSIYFVDGQRTNLTESSQNIATKYCPKRTPYSFKHYCIMRKTLAALQFNKKHSKEEKNTDLDEL